MQSNSGSTVQYERVLVFEIRNNIIKIPVFLQIGCEFEITAI